MRLGSNDGSNGFSTFRTGIRRAVAEAAVGYALYALPMHVHSTADVQKALSEVPKDSDALVLVWSNAGSSFRVLHPTQG
jgi:hypothetical protein